jgi:hypothetical protein
MGGLNARSTYGHKADTRLLVFYDRATSQNVTKRGIENPTSDRHKSAPWLVFSACAGQQRAEATDKRRQRQMRNFGEIQDLEHKSPWTNRNSEIERLEAELMENIPPQGFSAASSELRYRGEKEALAYSIPLGEEMLEGAISQPISLEVDRQDRQEPVQVH